MPNRVKFFIGTHIPSWLSKTDIPLFVSHRTLKRYKKNLPRAAGEWALDSGGFSELSIFGKFQMSAIEYASKVGQYQREIGNMILAAPQDWMCEPFMLSKTGKTIAQHQELTLRNYQELRSVAPTIPWIPVLQGWKFDDYMRHVDMYYHAGINLHEYECVGLGSVCRRQHTFMVEELIVALYQAGIRLHGFGFKIEGLKRVATSLRSADSMAWSWIGRRHHSCEFGKLNCANCFHFAMKWRKKVLRSIALPIQESFAYPGYSLNVPREQPNG